MQKRLIRIVIALTLGLILAGGIAAYQIHQEGNSKEISITAKNFGGPFTLTNHDGKIVTEKDFDNTWRLIYFGFTYCPAICPTELQKITSVLNDLGESGEKITPLFISVDPERDTIEVLKNYLSLFHTRLIGLTGSAEQVEQAKKSYKIYAAKVQDDTMSDYTVDHSSFIYFMNPNNDLVRIFRIEDSAEDMLEIIKHAFSTVKIEILQKN